jgi:hypothetical protein
MTSQYTGVVDHMKAVSTGAKFIHCCMHMVSLKTKQFPAKLRMVLDESMKTVDFIKFKLKIICSSMCGDGQNSF